jgi:hypothetical protein
MYLNRHLYCRLSIKESREVWALLLRFLIESTKLSDDQKEILLASDDAVMKDYAMSHFNAIMKYDEALSKGEFEEDLDLFREVLSKYSNIRLLHSRDELRSKVLQGMALIISYLSHFRYTESVPFSWHTRLLLY